MEQQHIIKWKDLRIGLVKSVKLISKQKYLLIVVITTFTSCFSQNKLTIKQMNEDLLKNNYIYYDIKNKDSTTIDGIKRTLSEYRLSGLKSCGINPNKKFSNIYIEDGFNDEEGFYNGIIIVDNKYACEVTTSHYKLNVDSLSYTKIEEGNFVFYSKKISIEELKNKYLNEFFRYQLVINDKVNGLDKCLSVDDYIPKPSIYSKSYYFNGKEIKNYQAIKINYNDIKNGIEGIPYLKDDKKEEFLECVKNLVK